MTAPRFWPALALIVFLAAGWRTGYTLATKADGDTCEVDGVPQTLCGDAIYYSAQGHANADGHWFEDPFRPGQPAADHPPLTALLVTPASALRDGDMAQRLTMVLVGTAAVGAIGLLGREVGGPRTGLLATLLAALYPNLWVNDALVMAESVTALLVAGVLWCTYRLVRRPSPAVAVLTGLLCGLAVLARSEQGLLAVVIVAPAVLAPSRSSQVRPLLARIGSVATVAVVAAATVAPWVAINLARFEEPVLLSTNDGLTLLGANCDQTFSGGSVGSWRLDCALAADGGDGDQSQTAAHQREAALTYIGDHLGELPAVMVIRVGRAWSLYAPDQMVWYNLGEGRPRWASWAGFQMYWFLVPLAFGGGVLLARSRVPVWPLAGTVVVVTITAALFYGLVRFRVPAEVSLVVLAAVTLDEILTGLAWPTRRERSPAP